MATLFYATVTNQTDWHTFGLIDRLGTAGWGMTVHVDPGSTGTAEVLIQGAGADGSVLTSGPGGGSDALTNETGPYAIGETRVESGHSYWWHTADPSTYPKLKLSIRAYFGSGSWSGWIEVDDGAFGPLTYCQYGTEANPDAIYYEVVTDSLIDLVVGAALAGTGLAYLIPYVETALAAIEGSVAFGIDCSTLPGAGPALDFPNLSTLSTETLHEWFQNAAWRFFCRCVPAPPGSDDPIPPPPPPIIPPVTVIDTQPAPVCDNADLCAYLLAMKEQLQTITAQLSYLRTDVRLIKNQHVPFGYVLGTLHTALTGAGSLAVSAILGVSVELTTIPGSSGVEEGDPLALFGLGWITLGNAAGWRLSTPLRHNPMWVDAALSDTLVGYSFAPLVVANIQEVSRQP